MAERQEVYDAIDSEREYQDRRWHGHAHEAESFILFIEHYAHEARTKASTTDFTNQTNLTNYLNDIRKIGALAVACMEQYGAPKR